MIGILFARALLLCSRVLLTGSDLLRHAANRTTALAVRILDERFS